jgi:hypothetical protein
MSHQLWTSPLSWVTGNPISLVVISDAQHLFFYSSKRFFFVPVTVPYLPGTQHWVNSGNLTYTTYPPSQCSRLDLSTRSHMSSHLIYQETYGLCFGTSRRTTSLFCDRCFLWSIPWRSSYLASTSSSTSPFLRFFFPVVPSVSLLSVHIDSHLSFCVGRHSLGTYRTPLCVWEST